MSLTPQPDEDEPTHWRRRAEDARRNAEQSIDQVTKKILADIADAYDQLAALAEAKLASQK
jgi:hypothetical protein